MRTKWMLLASGVIGLAMVLAVGWFFTGRPEPTAPPAETPSSNAAPDSPSVPAANPSGTAVKPGPIVLKAKPAGLYTNGFDSSTINHEYINVSWADLETSEGAFDWSSIDKELAAHPAVFFRLRLESGTTWGQHGWICSSSGGCVLITHSKTDTAAYTPKFWTTAYLGRFRTFMQAVGARYDANRQVLDIVNGACATNTAEPFILGGSGPGSAADVLYQNGLTQALHETCLRESTAIMVAALPHTRVSLATFNGLQTPAGSDWPAEHRILEALRAQYGEQLVYQNDGLAPESRCSGNPTAAAAADHICYMKAVSAPKGFQMGCGNKTTTCTQAAVVEAALAQGGCFVEHANWRHLGTAAEVSAYDTRLRQQPGCS